MADSGASARPLLKPAFGGLAPAAGRGAMPPAAWMARGAGQAWRVWRRTATLKGVGPRPRYAPPWCRKKPLPGAAFCGAVGGGQDRARGKGGRRTHPRHRRSPPPSPSGAWQDTGWHPCRCMHPGPSCATRWISFQTGRLRLLVPAMPSCRTCAAFGMNCTYEETLTKKSAIVTQWVDDLL